MAKKTQKRPGGFVVRGLSMAAYKRAIFAVGESDNVLTSTEFAARIGCATSTARTQIRALLAAGLCVPTKKIITSMAGIRQAVAAYEFREVRK